MSHRAGSERAAENQQTIKNLLKLEGNKVCADCKKNKRTTLPGMPTILEVTDVLRPKMGKLEHWSLCLHSVLRHPSGDGYSYQSGEIGRAGCLDR